MKNVYIVTLFLREDERGWVAWPVSENLLQGNKVSNVHMPLLKPGAIRGNHYHAHAFEYVFVFSGPCKARFSDPKTGETMEITVTDKEPKLFKISPHISTHLKILAGIIYFYYAMKTAYRIRKPLTSTDFRFFFEATAEVWGSKCCRA